MIEMSAVEHPDGVIEMKSQFPGCRPVHFFFPDARAFHEFAAGALRCDQAISPGFYPETQWGRELVDFVNRVLDPKK